MPKRLIYQFIILSSIFWLIFTFAPKKPKPFGDAVFNKEAKLIANLIKGETGSNVAFSHAIIPSIFYVVPALITDSDDQSNAFFIASIIWNYLFFLFSLWNYRIAFNIHTEFEISLYTICLIVIPSFLYYHLGFTAEVVTFFLFSVLCKQLSLLKTKKAWMRILFVGLVIALLIHSRPNFVLILPIGLGFSLLIKNYQLSFITSIAAVTFLLISNIYQANPNQNSSNKQVFLLEQIHAGQFFLRKEFTDWSFFNDEFRSNSIDYSDYLESKNKIGEKIQLGENPSIVYLKEIQNQINENPLESILLPFKKIIHGNSLHLGSTIPGRLNQQYISSNTFYFIVNIVLNIINWLIILLGIRYMVINRQTQLIMVVILIVLSFNIFNAISASEQRYLFPTKIFFVIGSVKFLSRYFLQTRVLNEY